MLMRAGAQMPQGRPILYRQFLEPRLEPGLHVFAASWCPKVGTLGTPQCMEEEAQAMHTLSAFAVGAEAASRIRLPLLSFAGCFRLR